MSKGYGLCYLAFLRVRPKIYIMLYMSKVTGMVSIMEYIRCVTFLMGFFCMHLAIVYSHTLTVSLSPKACCNQLSYLRDAGSIALSDVVVQAFRILKGIFPYSLHPR